MKTNRIHQWLRFLAGLLLLGAQPHFLSADEGDPRTPAADTVIVPYDPKKPLKDQKPDKLYVPYDRFLELWEFAKAARQAEQPPEAPQPYALTSSRYKARIEADRVIVNGTLEFSTFAKSWVSVPLPFTVPLSSLTLDQKPVALSDGSLPVAQPGRHTLGLQFELPLPAGAREFAWQVPRTAATRLILTLPEPRLTARLQPDAGIVEETRDGKKILTAALGATDAIRVSLVESEGTARVVEPAAASIHTIVFARPGFERQIAAITFEHPGAVRDSYTVGLPRGLQFADLEAPDLRSWKLSDSPEGQKLEIQLVQPAKEKYVLTLVTERATTLPEKRTAPVFTAGARRVERLTMLAAEPGIELTAEPAPALRQTEKTKMFNPRGWQEIDRSPVAGVWAGDAPLVYRAAAAPTKHEATIHYVYQVNRRKIELIAAMQLYAKGGPLFETSLSLPAGFEVLAVDSQRLQDSWREGDRLRVRFRGATPEATPLVVHLVRLYPSAPQQLDVQPLVLEGFAKVTGDAVIAAHKGVEATLSLREGGEAREIDPAKAATDFEILPPLERKRGFTIKGQNFAGQVALAALTPKLNVDWILHAQAHEAWVSLSLKAQLSMRQGSVDATTFSLPARLPEARVSGGDVRESRSKVVGDRRVYDVQFQDDIYEGVNFTVDLDVRIDGSFALPSPDFPGAQIVTGYVVADNASDYEMKLTTSNVALARVEEMPWQPVVTKSAGVFRALAGWSVSLAVDKLEKTESRTAYCAWAQMTTALRANGEEWHKAVWHLQNRSLQFLPVALPARAELMSVRVSGQGVRADTGKVDGRTATLVPLIRTKPGDISYDVEVVWRHVGQPFTKKDERKFADAELIGITVEQTFWDVWLPEDRKVTKSDGNLSEVIEVAREVEQSRAAVEELKALNKLLGSEKLDRTTWANAQYNFDAFCTVVGEKVSGNQMKLSGANTYSGANKQTDAQIQGRVSELIVANGSISEELNKAVEENRRLRDINAKRFGTQKPGGSGQAQSQDRLSQSLDEYAPQAEPAQNAAQALLFGQQGQRNQGGQNIVVSGNGTLTLGDGTVVINNEDSRWKANATNTIANNTLSNTNAAPPADASKSNFYLNDNIVLREAKKDNKPAEPVTKAPAEPAGKKEGQDLERFASPGFADGGNMKSGKAAADQGGKDSNGVSGEAGQPRSRGSNYARGNRAQQQEGQMEQLQQAAPRGNVNTQSEGTVYDRDLSRLAGAQPLPTNPAAATTQGREYQRSPFTEPTAPASSPTSSFSIAPAVPVRPLPAQMPPPASGPAGGRERIQAIGGAPMPQRLIEEAARTADAPALPAAPIQTGLEIAGRISLVVDFPTEGQVYHFQKVKAHAQLELQFADLKPGIRWGLLAIFAPIAAGLWWLSRPRRFRRSLA